MKPAPPAASSDLDRARALSRALSPASPAPDRPTPSPPRWARLTPREKATPMPTLEAGARWPRAVGWAIAATEARAGLAIDPKGLLVAAQHLDDEEAARIGGRIALAFDQLAAVGTPRGLWIDWANETGLVLRLGDGEQAVLLVLLGPRAGADPDAIRRALVAAGT
jgi:hypothetical protein